MRWRTSAGATTAVARVGAWSTRRGAGARRRQGAARPSGRLGREAAPRERGRHWCGSTRTPADADEPALPVRMTALEALMGIEEALRRVSRTRRCGVPAPRSARSFAARCRKISGYIEHGGWDLQSLEHPPAIRGIRVVVDRSSMERNYLGTSTGCQAVEITSKRLSGPSAFVRQTSGPEPVVIPPVLFDPRSDGRSYRRCDCGADRQLGARSTSRTMARG